MINKILLAILIGYMLRLFARVGTEHYLRITNTDIELKKHRGFHLSVMSYIVGTGLKYVGFVLLFAYLIKEYFL